MEFSIADNHPALSGHFPGAPVVPGTVLLDCVRDAVQTAFPATRISRVLWAKFLIPLEPGQGIDICLDSRGNRVTFVGRSKGIEILKGRLELAPVVGTVSD